MRWGFVWAEGSFGSGPDTRWFVSGKGLSDPDRHLVLHIQQHSVLDRDLCHDVETRDATWNDGRCARRDQEQFRSVNRNDTERVVGIPTRRHNQGNRGVDVESPNDLGGRCEVRFEEDDQLIGKTCSALAREVAANFAAINEQSCGVSLSLTAGGKEKILP
jgi:hypothetical protein